MKLKTTNEIVSFVNDLREKAGFANAYDNCDNTNAAVSVMYEIVEELLNVEIEICEECLG